MTSLFSTFVPRICYWMGFSHGNLFQARLLLAMFIYTLVYCAAHLGSLGKLNQVQHCTISSQSCLPAHCWLKARTQPAFIQHLCSECPSHDRCWGYGWEQARQTATPAGPKKEKRGIMNTKPFPGMWKRNHNLGSLVKIWDCWGWWCVKNQTGGGFKKESTPNRRGSPRMWPVAPPSSKLISHIKCFETIPNFSLPAT